MLIVAVVGVLNWLLCCLSVCVFDCFMLEFVLVVALVCVVTVVLGLAVVL